MLSLQPRGRVLIALVGFALSANPAFGAVVYRIGRPLSATERDSLERSAIDFREIGWAASQLAEALEVDSLGAGSLQPNFFDAGENIAATALSRDGWIRITTFLSISSDFVGQVLLDGDPSTAYTWNVLAPETFASTADHRELVTLDLGGEFLIKEVRFRPLATKPEHFLERFGIGISKEGIPTYYRTPTFPSVLEVKENTVADVSALLDPPVVTRFMQLQIFRSTPKEIGLAEFEVLGGGFVSRADYESEVIELDDIASWGEIRWAGRKDPSAEVTIRTRTGTDPQPEILWESRPEQGDSVVFLKGGGDLSLTEYKKKYADLSSVLKPQDPRDRVSADTEHWSFWSSPYPFENPGVRIVSPGPRKFIQIKVDFASTATDGGRLDYLEFRAAVPPAVRDVVGEIFPLQTDVGKATHFTYFIRPTILAGDSGFDGVEISTPFGVISVDSLRIDGVNQEDFSWAPKADGLGFEVALPRRLAAEDDGALVEVIFNAPVLREVGTSFDGRVFDSRKPDEVRQGISPGNAADEIESELLSVRGSLARSLLLVPRISPRVLTPNGDNINDVASLSYTLLRITAPVHVSIEIFTLAGAFVKEVHSGNDPIGQHSHSWDGTDSRSALVPPGIYLYRIALDVQSAREVESGIVAVSY